jgi:DNA-binding NarL/FixJ family response regulator
MEAPEIRYARTVDGVRIAYGWYSGVGVPVFYVGWPGSTPLAIAHEIPFAAALFDAIRGGQPGLRVDYRSTGYSGAIGGRLTVAEQAMDIEAVCLAVGEPLDAVAWCTASFATTRLAARRPELFRSLVLVAPDYEGCNSHYGPFWEMRRSMDEVEWVELYVQRAYGVRADESYAVARRWVQFASAGASRAHMDAFLAAEALGDVLPALTPPVAVIGTRGSREQSSQVAAAIPNCTFRFIEDNFQSEEAGRVIREVLEEMHPAAASGEPARNGPLPEPSDREHQVLALLAAGQSNAEIAERLVLSTRTVERHVQNIYNKLGVHNRVEAASWALRNGVG